MIDLLDPELQRTGALWSAFEELRREGPVVRCPGRRGPGYWAVLGHAEIAEAARDPAVWSSWWGTRPEALRPEAARRPLHNLDPPEHGVLRAVARTALVPFAFGPWITDAIAAFVARGGGDVVRELAEPLVARLFAVWLGLGVTAAGELLARVMAVHARGSALLDTARDDPEYPRRSSEAAFATGALAELLAADAPPGSLLGRLASSRRTGELEEEEARILATLLVEAGLPTLVDAIGSGVVELTRHPRPDDLGLAVAELLRLGSPILQFARRATRATRLGGQAIAEGEQVVLWFAAANRDPRVFSRPADFVLRRPNPHYAFGIGPHRCLGAAIAGEVLELFFAAWPAPAMAVLRAVPRASSYLRGYTEVRVAPRT